MPRQKYFAIAARIVAIAVAFVLLTAAGLKAHQLSTQPVVEQSWLDNRWGLMAGVEFELLLALFLLSGYWKKVIWGISLPVFLIFAGVSVQKAIAGNASCGCFGTIPVNPWHTLILDLAIVLLLALFFPNSPNCSPAVPLPPAAQHLRLSYMLFAGLALLLGSTAMAAMLSYRPARLSPEGNILGSNGLIILEPQQWIGQALPLRHYITAGSGSSSGEMFQIGGGRSLLVLYHNDCTQCHKILGELKDRIHETKNNKEKSTPQVILVELPPFDSKKPVKPLANWRHARLSARHDWFVPTPAAVLLQDGKVVAAADAIATVDQLLTLATISRPHEPTNMQTSVSAITDAAITSAGLPPAVTETEKPPQTVWHPDFTVDWDSGKGEIDLGFTELGSLHKARIMIRCTGGRDVPLLSPIRSECNCMSGKELENLAGGRAIVPLELVFEASKDPVVYRKRLLMASCENPDEKFILTVMSRVGLPLHMEPQEIDAGLLIAGQERQLDIRCVNDGKEEVRTIYGISSDPSCTLFVPRATIAGKGTINLPLLIKADSWKTDSRKVGISLNTTSEIQPIVRASVNYSITDRFSISPSRIDLIATPAGFRSSHSLIINGPTAQETIIERHEILTFHNLQAKLTVKQQPGRALLNVSCTAGKSEGEMSGIIRLHLQGHPQPIDVCISGTVIRTRAPNIPDGQQQPDRQFDAERTP